MFYAQRATNGTNIEPDSTKKKLVTAVCPTCKDRVSQRMGYARMAEEGFTSCHLITFIEYLRVQLYTYLDIEMIEKPC